MIAMNPDSQRLEEYYSMKDEYTKNIQSLTSKINNLKIMGGNLMSISALQSSLEDMNAHYDQLCILIDSISESAKEMEV